MIKEIPSPKRCVPLVPKLRLRGGGVFLESLAPVSVNSAANVITLNDSFIVAKKLNWLTVRWMESKGFLIPYWLQSSALIRRLYIKRMKDVISHLLFLPIVPKCDVR